MKKELTIAVAAAVSLPLFACTTIVAGKNATVTGHILLAHNEDDGGDYKVIHGYVPPRSFRDGAKISALKRHAMVPQVGRTLGFYWSEVRSPGGGGPFADVFLNDCGVAIVSNNGRGKPDDDASKLVDGGLAWALQKQLHTSYIPATMY